MGGRRCPGSSLPRRWNCWQSEDKRLKLIRDLKYLPAGICSAGGLGAASLLPFLMKAKLFLRTVGALSTVLAEVGRSWPRVSDLGLK